METISLYPSSKRQSLQDQYMEASIPFSRGQVKPSELEVGETSRRCFTMQDAQDGNLPLQTKALSLWPDGSLRWLHLICITEGHKAPYRLSRQQGNAATSDTAGTATEKPLICEQEDRINIDTGRLSWSIPKQLPVPLSECVHGILTGIAVASTTGKLDVTSFSQHAGLFVKGTYTRGVDHLLYGTARARTSLQVKIHSSGPLQGTVLVTARPSRNHYQSLLSCRIRIDVWKDSSIVRLSIQWLNLEDKQAAFVRDIRFRLPLAFRATKAVLGCEYGVCKIPISGNEEVYLLQYDAERYWAMRTGWGGTDIDLASGGANGRKAPGWAVVSGEGRSVGVYIPLFSQEYPNELSLNAHEMCIGLWPERANKEIKARHRILPRGPENDPYGKSAYDSIMTQPYWSFFSIEDECLEIVPGMGKRQEIIFDFDVSQPEIFGILSEKSHLSPDRGVVDPEYVASTRVFGPALAPGVPGFERIEGMLQNVLGWYRRHMNGGWTWGKFDYGDLVYKVYTPDTRLDKKRMGKEREARSGYWNNNENDPLQGLLSHFYLTGNREAWDLGCAAARHLLDVDIHHGDVVGLHSHTFGHCFRSSGYRSMDHLWVDGLFTYYSSVGDPFDKEDLDGLRRMALNEIQVRPFTEDTLRNFVLGITMNIMFYESTGEEDHLKTALEVARDLMEYQAPEGYFPGGGPAWAERNRAGEGFPGEFDGPSTLSELHTMEALHRLHEWSGEKDVEESFLRLVRWFVSCNLQKAKDAVRANTMPKGEDNPRGLGMFNSGTIFALPALAYAYTITHDAEIVKSGARMLRHLADNQLGRENHPLWEGIWFEHAEVTEADENQTVPQRINAEDAINNYITPLSSSFALYKVRPMMWAVKDAGLVDEINRVIQA